MRKKGCNIITNCCFHLFTFQFRCLFLIYYYILYCYCGIYAHPHKCQIYTAIIMIAIVCLNKYARCGTKMISLTHHNIIILYRPFAIEFYFSQRRLNAAHCMVLINIERLVVNIIFMSICEYTNTNE